MYSAESCVFRSMSRRYRYMAAISTHNPYEVNFDANGSRYCADLGFSCGLELKVEALGSGVSMAAKLKLGIPLHHISVVSTHAMLFEAMTAFPGQV